MWAEDDEQALHAQAGFLARKLEWVQERLASMRGKSGAAVRDGEAWTVRD